MNDDGPPLTVDEVERTLRRVPRAWFDIEGRGAVYLRISHRLIESRVCRTLDLANVEVEKEHRGQGIFSRCIATVEDAARRMACDAVYVELITNPVVTDALARRGYALAIPNGLTWEAYKVF